MAINRSLHSVNEESEPLFDKAIGKRSSFPTPCKKDLIACQLDENSAR
jgi:hypothetical protein